MMNPASVRAAKAGREKSSKTAVQNTKSGVDGKSVEAPNPKIQPTAEQLRLAQIINDTKESDDPELKNKIDQVIELTGKTRDEAVVALHDCDNDPNRAIDMLLDGDAYQGEWELSGKKKKNRQNSSGNRPSDGNTQNSVINNKENRNRSERGRDVDKEQDGTRNRGPPRLNRGGSNRGWRGRENEKNERNLEENRHEERFNDGRGRGRMMNGPGRGRGRGGPRSRTFQNRGSSHNTFPKSIETWTNSTADHADGSGDNSTMSVGNWGDSFPPTEDWDNEDWTGSLAETKVFTPSVSVSSSAPPLQDSTNTSESIDLASLLQKPSQAANSLSSLSASQQESQFLSQYTQLATKSLKTAIGIPVTSNQPSSYQSIQSTTCSSSPNFPSVKFSLSPSFSANTISSSQILTSSSPPSLNSTSSCGTCLPSGSQNSRLSSNGTVPPLSQRPKSQKARLPPPSKIPSSAVEMPDDAVASLDVQFGGLEFGSESSAFEFPTETASFQVSSGNASTSSNHVTSLASSPTSNLSTSVLPAQMSNSINKSDNHSAYTPHVSSKDTLQSSLAQASQNTLSQSTLVQNTLSHSQKSSGSDLSPFNAQTEKKATPFGNQRTSQTSGVDVSLSTGKNESIGLSSSYVSQSNQSSSYQPTYQGQKSSFASHQSTLLSSSTYGHSSLPAHQTGLASVQSSVAPSGLNTTQASTGFGISQSQTVSYTGPTATSSTFSTPAPTSFPNSTQPTSSSYQNQTSSFSTQSQTTYSTQNPATYGSHQSSLSQTASTVFSSNQSQVTAYGSQSSYGSSSVSTVPSQTSLHGPVSSTKLTANLSSSTKESALDSSSQTYDNCHAATSTTNLTAALTTTASSITSSSVNVSSGLNLSTNTSVNSSTSSTTKNTLSSSKTGLPNMPPGVPAVLGHQYIMSQASLPFYGLQQAPVYSYEDMQILQQRLPLHGYYDITSFQPATSLTGRDSGLANVAYSGADGKFSRGDNASPVPTTLSQQQATTQQHQQAFINPTLPPGYGYYYPGSVVPGTFPQYGTPIFPMPPVTNATNSTQFQKPSAYGSHAYSSGYDNIGQTQDYKGGYGSGSQSQSKGVGGSSSTSGGSSSGTDISGSVYSKTHNQLGKSFDKPGFPTGTPPPFNMPGTQTGPMGTPSTPYAAAPFIAMMTHQQHPSPMLHHQLHPESQGPSSQRSNQSGGQQKSGSGPKQNFPPNYWAAN